MSEAGKTPDDQSGIPSGTETAAAPSSGPETGTREVTSGDTPDVTSRDSASKEPEGTGSEQSTQVAVPSPHDHTGDATAGTESGGDDRPSTSGSDSEPQEVAERASAPEGERPRIADKTALSPEEMDKALDAVDKLEKGEVLAEADRELLRRLGAEVAGENRSANEYDTLASRCHGVAKDFKEMEEENKERLGTFYKVATSAAAVDEGYPVASKLFLKTVAAVPAGAEAKQVANAGKHTIETTEDLTSKSMVETLENVAERAAEFLPAPIDDRLQAAAEGLRSRRQLKELSRLDPDSAEYKAKVRQFAEEKKSRLARRQCRSLKGIALGEEGCRLAFAGESAVVAGGKIGASLHDNLAWSKAENQRREAAEQYALKRRIEFQECARIERFKAQLARCRDGYAGCPFSSASPLRPE